MDKDREIIFGSETPSKTADKPFTIVLGNPPTDETDTWFEWLS